MPGTHDWYLNAVPNDEVILRLNLTIPSDQLSLRQPFLHSVGDVSVQRIANDVTANVTIANNGSIEANASMLPHPVSEEI